MSIMIPLHSHKFRVVPLGRSDFAEAFMSNVANAEVDLVNRVFRVQVRQSRDTITLSAVDDAVRNKWIPELQLDIGSNSFSDGKLIRFVYEPRLNEEVREPVKHSLRFDYSCGDVAMHVIEWAFTSFVMERMETPEGAPKTRRPARTVEDSEVVTPEVAMARLDAENAKL